MQLFLIPCVGNLLICNFSWRLNKDTALQKYKNISGGHYTNHNENLKK